MGRYADRGHVGDGGQVSGGLLRGRDEGRGAAVTPTPFSHQDCRWFQHGRVPPRRQLFRLYFRRHLVYATGARLLHAEDWAGVVGGFGHIGRPLPAFPRCWSQRRRPGGNGNWHGPHRRRGPLGNAVPAAETSGRTWLAHYLSSVLGTAFAFIPVSIGSLAGVGENDAGIAFGLLNTSQQLGGAIGVAVASSVAASHFHHLVSRDYATGPALTGGFQWALWVCGLTALAAVPATFLLVRRSEMARAVAASHEETPVPAGAEAN